MEPTDGPKFYSIEKLLSRSVQPFPDLPPDEFEVLKQSIEDKGLLNPIGLSEDEFLFDGHQRCKAMLENGKKRIAAKDVKIMKGVTRDNMLEYALTSNTVRRAVTAKDKADRMHACRALGWSQTRIAKAFGMSQPGVSQLMAAYPAENPEPVVITGEDGKSYTPDPPRPKEPKDVKAHPWAWNGANFKGVQRAYTLLEMKPPYGLTETQWVDLGIMLDKLSGIVTRTRGQIKTELSGIDPEADDEDPAEIEG